MSIFKPLLVLLLVGAVPALADDADGMHRGPGRMDVMDSRVFGNMSPEGQRTMTEAMRAARPADRDAAHDAVRAARDRMMALLSADRLDVAALKRSMDAERESVNAMKVRQQTAMLEAFQRLSAADRKAFVAGARSMRQRIEQKMGDRRDGPPPPM